MQRVQQIFAAIVLATLVALAAAQAAVDGPPPPDRIWSNAHLVGLPDDMNATVEEPICHPAKFVLCPPRPPKALPENATPDQLRWQPIIDFTKHSCYNVPAIDIHGNVSKGLAHDFDNGHRDCHDEWDLDNSQVYVRTRCNHGWCVHMYAYYFEKDVHTYHSVDPLGNKHDWESVVIWVNMTGGQQTAKWVGVSNPPLTGPWETEWWNVLDRAEFVDDHIKLIFDKYSPMKGHNFRYIENHADYFPRNHKKAWIRGALVDYQNGWPSTELRDQMIYFPWPRKAILRFRDADYADWLDASRKNYGGMEFDTGRDQWDSD